MGKKPSPSRIKFRAQRKAKRQADPIVQAKAAQWRESRKEEN